MSCTFRCTVSVDAEQYHHANLYNTVREHTRLFDYHYPNRGVMDAQMDFAQYCVNLPDNINAEKLRVCLESLGLILFDVAGMVKRQMVAEIKLQVRETVMGKLRNVSDNLKVGLYIKEIKPLPNYKLGVVFGALLTSNDEELFTIGDGMQLNKVTV